MTVKVGIKRFAVVLLHAFVLWTLCSAIMGIGLGTEVASIETVLIVHAVAAPVISAAVSMVYFKKFAYTTPLQTASIFVAFIVVMDFFVVALLILGSFEMFASVLGTWIPFAAMFAAIYLTGVCVRKAARPVAAP